MKKLIFALILSIFCAARLVYAEMLQVSADGTVFLSTDSIEVKQNSDGKYVSGIVYFKENGKTQASPFAASCGKKGGVITFRNGDGSMSDGHAWTYSGKTVFDSISITACKVTGM